MPYIFQVSTNNCMAEHVHAVEQLTNWH